MHFLEAVKNFSLRTKDFLVEKFRSHPFEYGFYVLAVVVVLVSTTIVSFLNQPAGSALSTSWDSQKATYLAKRALLNPTQEDIQQLTNAGSSHAAVAILFSQPSAQDVTAYQKEVAAIESKKSSYKTEKGYYDGLYAYEMVHDPHRVQRKVYYLWENIFSVDAMMEKEDGINFSDVETLHQLLYKNALGNYLTMVSAMPTNYAMAKYLNLTNSPKNNPNENFSREFMQLFLMGPYTPLDTKMTTLNYSDADVNALAYILTGYRPDYTNHTIVFTPKQHYAGEKVFLGSATNDPAHIVSYIESKREKQMSEFLADKLLKYYVSDNPKPEDIATLSQIIEKNNFAIELTLKALFTSSFFYDSTYMTQERYKSPMELFAAFYTDLFGLHNFSVMPNPVLLSDLDFEPYHPGSIFGRAGFTKNSLFYSGTIVNRWISDTNKLLLSLPLSEKELAVKNLLAGGIMSASSNLYIGMTLPKNVLDTITTYYKNNAQIQIKMSSLGLLFAQPEFLLESGNAQSVALASSSFTSNQQFGKLVVVRLRGGWDYQELVANTKDPKYLSNRGALALTPQNSTPIGNGYVLNNSATSLLPLIQKKEAFFISSVGLPNHSRAHDVASMQMETGLLPNNEGILTKLSQVVPNLSLVSLTNTPPIMLGGASSLQIGGTGLLLYPQAKKQNALETKTEEVLSKMMHQRTFPQALAAYYAQAFLLDSLAKENIASGGKGTPGPTNSTQFPFLAQLMNQRIGDAYYLYGDGSYDTHVREQPKFDTQVHDLFGNLVNFFNKESSKEKLTIVVFSEFGRTDKTNGGQGTDHGTGGGMVILSNALTLPEMTGTLTPSTDPTNWTKVQVNAQDVWATLFHDIYGISQSSVFGSGKALTSYPVGVE